MLAIAKTIKMLIYIKDTKTSIPLTFFTINISLERPEGTPPIGLGP